MFGMLPVFQKIFMITNDWRSPCESQEIGTNFVELNAMRSTRLTKNLLTIPSSSTDVQSNNGSWKTCSNLVPANGKELVSLVSLQTCDNYRGVLRQVKVHVVFKDGGRT